MVSGWWLVAGGWVGGCWSEDGLLVNGRWLAVSDCWLVQGVWCLVVVRVCCAGGLATGLELAAGG